HQTPPETLTRFATAVGWALRVLREERAPREELERVLVEAMTGLEGLSEEQAGQWLRVAWFLVLLIFHRRDPAEYTELEGLIEQRARGSRFRIREDRADGQDDGAGRRGARRSARTRRRGGARRGAWTAPGAGGCPDG